jgi:hypothetical protein
MRPCREATDLGFRAPVSTEQERRGEARRDNDEQSAERGYEARSGERWFCYKALTSVTNPLPRPKSAPERSRTSTSLEGSQGPQPSGSGSAEVGFGLLKPFQVL